MGAQARHHAKAPGGRGSRSPNPLQRESLPAGAFWRDGTPYRVRCPTGFGKVGSASGRSETRYPVGCLTSRRGRPGWCGCRSRRANECRDRRVTARAAAPGRVGKTQREGEGGAAASLTRIGLRWARSPSSRCSGSWWRCARRGAGARGDLQLELFGPHQVDGGEPAGDEALGGLAAAA